VRPVVLRGSNEPELRPQASHPLKEIHAAMRQRLGGSMHPADDVELMLHERVEIALLGVAEVVRPLKRSELCLE
jgi:hypothetical protein